MSFGELSLKNKVLKGSILLITIFAFFRLRYFLEDFVYSQNTDKYHINLASELVLQAWMYEYAEGPFKGEFPALPTGYVEPEVFNLTYVPDDFPTYQDKFKICYSSSYACKKGVLETLLFMERLHCQSTKDQENPIFCLRKTIFSEEGKTEGIVERCIYGYNTEKNIVKSIQFGILRYDLGECMYLVS